MYRIERIDSVTSTNDVCKERAAAGEKGNYVLISKEQTMGKGRLGRTWESEKGAGIYMSILERPDIHISMVPKLSLIMGLAARKAIEEVTGLQVTVKWPNDIVISGKKISGILCEMGLKNDNKDVDFAVIGIGINLYQEGFGEELKDRATSILMEKALLGADFSIESKENRDKYREKLENAVVKSWDSYYNEFLRSGSFKGFTDEFVDNCININNKVEVLDPKGEYQGMAVGINDNGELLVKVDNKEVRAIVSGEVSVRGVYGYV